MGHKSAAPACMDCSWDPCKVRPRSSNPRDRSERGSPFLRLQRHYSSLCVTAGFSILQKTMLVSLRGSRSTVSGFPAVIGNKAGAIRHLCELTPMTSICAQLEWALTAKSIQASMHQNVSCHRFLYMHKHAGSSSNH